MSGPENGGTSLFDCKCGAELEVFFSENESRGWHECPNCEFSEFPDDLEPTEEYAEKYL